MTEPPADVRPVAARRPLNASRVGVRPSSGGQAATGREVSDLLCTEASTTGLTLADGLDVEAWADIGGQLRRAVEGGLWMCGDWWIYGERVYGQRARAVAEGIGWTLQTCMNAGTVARAFAPSRRREVLSFSHHAEVAALDEHAQDEMLDQAEAEGWSRERLRAEVAQRRRSVPARRPEQIDAGEQLADWSSTDGRLSLVHGDFRDRLADLPDASVDLLLTDPPYPSEFVPLWSDLGELAARVLGPRGLLIAWAPSLTLDEVHRRLGEHLTYGWQFALLLPGSNTRILGRHIIHAYRPVVAYTTGTWPAGAWGSDVLTSPTAEKDAYRWQQSTAPAVELIERYCPLDGLVLDTFAGVASFGVAARSAGRRFLGCEADGQRFEQAVERLATVEPCADH